MIPCQVVHGRCNVGPHGIGLRGVCSLQGTHQARNQSRTSVRKFIPSQGKRAHGRQNYGHCAISLSMLQSLHKRRTCVARFDTVDCFLKTDIQRVFQGTNLICRMRMQFLKCYSRIDRPINDQKTCSVFFRNVASLFDFPYFFVFAEGRREVAWRFWVSM